MKYARISGTGSYLPEKILENSDLEKMVDTSDEWIFDRTGIRRRHIADEHETASTMAHLASQRAIDAAGITPNEIDLIIVATCTPDRFFPSTACFLQEQLNIERALPAFDISAACAGFIYALSVADQYIRTQTVKTALVVGSDVMSRSVDWTDRSTCILFGDGAGAVVLQASDEPGIHSTHLHAQGQYKDLLFYPNDVAAPGMKTSSRYLQMKGSDVFRLAVKAMGDAVDEALDVNQFTKSSVDWLVPHQANLRIIKAMAKKLELPMERVVLTVEEHGNTSAASIPMALDVAIRDGRIKAGETLLLEGFGGGMAWGSAMVTY